MISFLKNHPFAVKAVFKTSLVLTYALPKEQLQNLIPECLELDTFNDKWAFVAVAMVDTKELRPKGFPKLLGNNFTLIGYRVFVRYKNQKGKRLRGLFILKSETNKSKMAFLGNLFTYYKYSKTAIKFIEKEKHISVISIGSHINIKTFFDSETVDLPTNSPFKNWKESRKFAGPLPFTFTYNETKKEVLIIEGVRNNWKPKPVDVLESLIGFIQSKPEFKNAKLANAFIIQNVPYQWKKGTIEKWEN